MLNPAHLLLKPMARAAAIVLALTLGGHDVQAQAITAPPIHYQSRILPNGLKVFTVLDKTTSNVSVQMWYGVGSKDDPAGRSGFAHLFEHLMFKGARDMPPEYLDRLTEDVGGFNNASTADDYTEYHEVVPANHLERILWAEAERLGGLVVDQANFESERKVVEEELRQRVLADPYGRLFQLAITEASFTTHPYHRPGIGSIADLDAASLADVRAFHALYYRPDNANLIVVGDFDPDKLNAWIDRYFSPIPRPSYPIPRVTAVEPARTKATTYDVYGPNVPLPAVVLSFAAPNASSPDAAALRVIDALLSTGKSSRLYDTLVYRDQVAQSVFSEADLRQQGGLFAVGAVLASGKTPEQGELALRKQLTRLRDTPVSAAELAAAKNQLIAGVMRDRETLEGRGSELGTAITVEGDAARINEDVIALTAVSIEQVQSAAKRYLIDDRRVTLRYLPDSVRPAGQVETLSQDSSLVAAAPLIAPKIMPVNILAAPDQRQAPPNPGPLVVAAKPAPIERTLANGLRVIIAHTSDLPIVTVELTVKSGAVFDPQTKSGLSNVVVNLLPQGTTSRSAGQISSQVESLGGSISAGADYDSASVTLSGLASTLPQGLPILADVIHHPAFEQSELDRFRFQQIDALTVDLQEPGALARLAMRPLVFGDGPYGRPVSGVAASLKRISRADIIAQYERLYRPDNAVLVITGDVEPEIGFALAQKAFGDWRRPDTPTPITPWARPVSSDRVLVINLPESGQAAVMVGARSAGRQDPAYYQVDVANALLGGGYSARLNEEIRVKRGLSYGAGSSVSAHRDVGLFTASAQTRAEAAAEVADLMLRETQGLAAAPPSPLELDARKAALIGTFERTAETSGGLAALLSDDAARGLAPQETTRYPQAINAVNPDQARNGALKLVDPAALRLVVVGDARLFIAALRKRFSNVTLINSDRLDLEAADLGRPEN